MKREIKFRGKDIITDEWIYGYPFVDVAGYECIIPNGVLEGMRCVHVNTIGQYTGLKDQYGVEIYEGDILMCIGKREDNKGRKYIRRVLFINGTFGMKVKEYKCVSSLCNHVVNGMINWEVIGNIYDNQELLEE